MTKTFSYLLFAVFLISCKPSVYKISGEVTNVNLNGQTITVSERINRQFVTIGTAVVEDAKFMLTGSCDSAKIVYLHGAYLSGTPFQQVFILENGKINVIIDSVKITFSGTTENDILQRYATEKDALNAEISEFFESQEEDGTIKNQEFLEQKYAEFEAKEKEADLNFIKNNANTLAGIFIFSNSYYYLSIVEKENIFALMTDKTKNNSSIKQIIETTEIEKNTAIGKPFTDIAALTPDGKKLSLSMLVGKTDYLLIDFWASWCGPCIRSFPELKELYGKNVSRLEILGVSLDREKDSWIKAIAQYELGWKHISDLKYWDCEGAKLYGVTSIPATVLINKEGTIVGRNLKVKEIEKIIAIKQ